MIDLALEMMGVDPGKGLAGGTGSDAGLVHDGDCHPALCEMIGDGGTDDAGTDDQCSVVAFRH